MTNSSKWEERHIILTIVKKLTTDFGCLTMSITYSLIVDKIFLSPELYIYYSKR